MTQLFFISYKINKNKYREVKDIALSRPFMEQVCHEEAPCLLKIVP